LSMDKISGDEIHREVKQSLWIKKRTTFEP